MDIPIGASHAMCARGVLQWKKHGSATNLILPGITSGVTAPRRRPAFRSELSTSAIHIYPQPLPREAPIMTTQTFISRAGPPRGDET